MSMIIFFIQVLINYFNYRLNNIYIFNTNSVYIIVYNRGWQVFSSEIRVVYQPFTKAYKKKNQ